MGYKGAKHVHVPHIDRLYILTSGQEVGTAPGVLRSSIHIMVLLNKAEESWSTDTIF